MAGTEAESAIEGGAGVFSVGVSVLGPLLSACGMGAKLAISPNLSASSASLFASCTSAEVAAGSTLPPRTFLHSAARYTPSLAASGRAEE